RNDLHPGIEPAQARDAIRLQAGAVDQIARRDRLAIGLERQPGGLALDRHDAPREANLAAAIADQLAEAQGHRPIIDDAGLRHDQAGDAAHVRLVLAQLAGGEPPHAVETIGLTAPLQLAQAAELVLAGRHHQLAAALVSDAVLGAEAIHGVAPGDAVLRL